MSIRNQSPHQPLVGQTFEREGCTYLCLAAHEDSVLVLQHGVSGRPRNYIVCHHPELEKDGGLCWKHGEYFTIYYYQSAGRSDPMSAAFADAVARLLKQSVIAFHFNPLDEADKEQMIIDGEGLPEGAEEAVTLLVEAIPALDDDDLANLDDAIMSYVDSISGYTGKELIDDVMSCYPQFHYRILQENHRFEI